MAHRITTWTEGHLAIIELARTFNIPCPSVVKTGGKTSRCCYGRPTCTIHLSAVDWHGVEQATLHEFTHALCFERLRRNHGHAEVFYDTLHEALRAWGGEDAVLAYEWHNEYETIWRYARNAGLTDQPWHRHAKRAATAGVGVTPAGRPDIKLVKPGDVVAFRHRGVALTGVVRSADRGCRAAVMVGGQKWYVPQPQLTVLEGPGAKRVAAAVDKAYTRPVKYRSGTLPRIAPGRFVGRGIDSVID